MPKNKLPLEYSADSPLIGPKEQALFSIEDTREKADQLQAILVPRLELILHAAQDQIQEIYGEEALSQELFRVFKSPAHRKQAKTTADFEEASVGFCLKLVKNWFFQLQITCNSSHLSVGLFGLRGREANPIISVMKSYKNEIANLVNLCYLSVESEAFRSDFIASAPEEPLDMETFIDHLRFSGEKEWNNTTIRASQLSLPIIDLDDSQLIIDGLISLYPIFNAASSVFRGEKGSFTQDFECFLSWSKYSILNLLSDQDANLDINLFPDNVDEKETFREGSVKKTQVNAYERDPKARQKCIEHYGTSCSVCGFDFGQTFGKHGEGFIHVHHLRPLSEIAEEYEVDPIQDLRPVCPNCHAMLHRKSPTLSIEQLQQILKDHNT